MIQADIIQIIFQENDKQTVYGNRIPNEYYNLAKVEILLENGIKQLQYKGCWDLALDTLFKLAKVDTKPHMDLNGNL